MPQTIWHFYSGAKHNLNIKNVDVTNNEYDANIIVDLQYVPDNETQRIVARDGRTDKLIAPNDGPDKCTRVFVAIFVGSYQEDSVINDGYSFLHYKFRTIANIDVVLLEKQIVSCYQRLNNRFKYTVNIRRFGLSKGYSKLEMNDNAFIKDFVHLEN